MKKIAIYLCTGILVLGLAACGRDAQGNDGSQNTQQTGSSDNQGGGASWGGIGDDSSEAGGADDGQQTGAGTGDGQQEAGGADDGQQAGGQGGEDAPEGWSQEMEGLKSAVLEALGENYWPNMAVDSEMLEMLFGVTSDMYEDYMGEIPMMSAHVDKLVIVKAKEGKAEEVREALDAYRDSQVNDTMQYPMNLGKIQASRVEAAGDYVIFAMLGGDDTEAESEEAQIAYCQEVNDLAIEAIKARLGQ